MHGKGIRPLGRPKELIEKHLQPDDYIINCAYQNTPISSVKEPGCIKIAPDDCIVLLNDNLKKVMGLPFRQREQRLLFRAVERYLDLANRAPATLKKMKKEFGHSIAEIPAKLRTLIEEELKGNL
jgi:hypothetical protein